MRRGLGDGPAKHTAVMAAVARCRADEYVPTIIVTCPNHAGRAHREQRQHVMARMATSNKTPAAQRNTLVSHNISNAQQVAYIVNSGEGSVMAIMIALLATGSCDQRTEPCC